MKIHIIKKEVAGKAFMVIFLISLVMVQGCTKKFEEINTAEDRITTDKVDVSLLGPAFAQAVYNGMFQDRTQFQVLQNLYGDIYAQYFAVTHKNFPSDQFQEVGAWTGDYGWNRIYSIAAPQVYFVEQYTAKNSMPLENALAKVWKVVFYHRITDIWGPVIYSQFGNGKTSVAYDSQKSMYMDFFKVLDEAVAVLKTSSGKNAFGNNDLIYNGSVDKWLTFANSLRLRLALRIAYVEPQMAKEQAEKAVAAGVMMLNDNNANILTTDNSKNGYLKITYIDEFHMSASMGSVMAGYEDPRLPVFFEPAHVGGGYKGLRNGVSVLDRQDRTTLNNAHSFIGSKWISPVSKGHAGHTATENPPIGVMNAAEVYFLRAEGALRGWNMGGTAKDLYEEGIRKSITENTSATAPQIDAYVTSNKTPKALNDKFNSPAMSDIPVAFLAAGSFDKKLEQIITQKWISLFPNSFEAWAERRRTGFPVGYPVITSSNSEVPANALIRRLTFAVPEFSSNALAVEAAVGLLSGGNKNSTKLWWDAK